MLSEIKLEDTGLDSKVLWACRRPLPLQSTFSFQIYLSREAVHVWLQHFCDVSRSLLCIHMVTTHCKHVCAGAENGRNSQKELDFAVAVLYCKCCCDQYPFGTGGSNVH